MGESIPDLEKATKSSEPGNTFDIFPCRITNFGYELISANVASGSTVQIAERDI